MECLKKLVEMVKKIAVSRLQHILKQSVLKFKKLPKAKKVLFLTELLHWLFKKNKENI